MEVITAKQIIKKYEVQGRTLFFVRRKLEVLGYIQQIRHGSQTYALLKELPSSLVTLDTEYAESMYTYTMSQAYTDALAGLKGLERPLNKWLTKLKKAQVVNDLVTTIIEALNTIKIAGLHLQTNPPNEELLLLQFQSVPIHDNLLHPYSVSLQKRIENVLSLLDDMLKLMEIQPEHKDTGLTRAIERIIDSLATVNLPTFREVLIERTE